MLDSGHSTTHAWGHTTDGRYGRGVPIPVPKHVLDSGQSTIHGGTPLTGVKVLGSRVGHSSESHGSLWGWALQAVSEVVSAGEELTRSGRE